MQITMRNGPTKPDAGSRLTSLSGSHRGFLNEMLSPSHPRLAITSEQLRCASQCVLVCRLERLL